MYPEISGLYFIYILKISSSHVICAVQHINPAIGLSIQKNIELVPRSHWHMSDILDICNVIKVFIVEQFHCIFPYLLYSSVFNDIKAMHSTCRVIGKLSNGFT